MISIMFSRLKKLSHTNFISLSFIFVIANFLANILNYLFHFFVSRAYGPATYSEIVSLFSHLYILGVPSLIFTTLVIKYIGRGQTKSAQLQRFSQLYTSLQPRSPLFFIALLGFSFLFYFLGLYDNLSSLSSLTLVLFFLASLAMAYLSSFLQAFQAFAILALGLILATSFKFFGGLLAYFAHFHSLSLIWSFLLLGVAAQLFVVYRYFRRHLLSKLQSVKPIPLKSFFHRLKSPHYLIMIISLLSTTAIVNLDVIFARKILPPQSAGFYGAWSMLAKIIMYAGGPISTVAFVFFADRRQTHHKGKLLLFSSLINLLAGGFLFLIYTFFADKIVISLFGASFLPIAGYLSYAAIFGLFYSLINNLNNYFISQDSRASLLTFLFLIFQLLGFAFNVKTLSQIMILQLLLAVTIFLFQLFYLFLSTKSR